MKNVNHEKIFDRLNKAKDCNADLDDKIAPFTVQEHVNPPINIFGQSISHN